MKKFMFNKINIFLILALVIFSACEEDSNPFGGLGDNDEETNTERCGDVSDSVKDFYADDATRLAIGLINQSGSITSGSVLIPPALEERMSDVLTAVHASEFAARDSVVDIYDVHIFPSYSLKEVVVEVSTDTSGVAWVNNWLDGNRFTGNADADAIVSTYDLEIDEVLLLGDNAVIILGSESALNIPALVEDLSAIEGIADVGTREESGDGDDITVTSIPGSGDDNEDSYKVVYKVAYDDCDNSCLKARFYEFNVNDNCNVTYINTYGDEAPELEDRE